jgi:hypothetical protein
LLTHAGRISHQQALDKSNAEYVAYQQQRKEQQKIQSLNELEADIKQLAAAVERRA